MFYEIYGEICSHGINGPDTIIFGLVYCMFGSCGRLLWYKMGKTGQSNTLRHNFEEESPGKHPIQKNLINPKPRDEGWWEIWEFTDTHQPWRQFSPLTCPISSCLGNRKSIKYMHRKFRALNPDPRKRERSKTFKCPQVAQTLSDSARFETRYPDAEKWIFLGKKFVLCSHTNVMWTYEKNMPRLVGGGWMRLARSIARGRAGLIYNCRNHQGLVQLSGKSGDKRRSRWSRKFMKVAILGKLRIFVTNV